MGILIDNQKSVNLNSRKAAQLQIQETIITIFIVIIIIVIGMSLFFKYQESSIKQEARQFRFEQLSNTILTLPDTSEFVYTQDGQKMFAIDTTKLLALKSLIGKRRAYYESKYSYKNITIIEVYPKKNSLECNEGNMQNCGIWTLYNRIPEKYSNSRVSDIPKFRKETPVSLYYPKTGIYTVGLLIVEEYEI